MAKNSQEYWAERARQDKVKVIKTGEQGINNLKRLLLLNLKDVESKIKDFYDKYGDTPAEYMTHKDWEKYKARLKKLAERYPDDKFLQQIAKQNVPKYQIDRLKALELDLQMQLTEATSGQEQGIYKTLNDVSKVSQATLAKRMKQTLGLTFNSIADRKMKQILMSDWSGSNWSDRLWVDRAVVGKKVTEILEKGVVQGTSLQKMASELKQATNQSFNNAFRLIRTETSHIDGQVTLEGYKQAGEELGLEYYEYDAFLDTRTSSICRELNGNRFKVSEAEVGVNYPPMHPNCRSTTQLVLDEDYIDLGSNGNDSNFDSSQEKIKPNKKDPAILAGVRKDLPMTREKANNLNANPNYHKAPEYRFNCQSCVIAFEARLRGYDVKAKPNYRIPNTTPMKLAQNQSLAWKNNLTGLHPSFKNSSKNGNDLYYWLDKNVKNSQRFTFSYQYLGRDGDKNSHIVCLDKNKQGKLRLYDPQRGKTYIGGDLRRFINKRDILRSRILRIDNCTFNKKVVEDVLEI